MHSQNIAAGFLRNYSIETISSRPADITTFAAMLPPGTRVYVACPPNRNPSDLVVAGECLSKFGHIPVPHIPAHAIADDDRLEGLLHQLTSRAEVTEILVIGGTHLKPIGTFDTAIQLLESDLFAQFNIRRIAIAGYPEGHPTIAGDVLMQSLTQKLERIRQIGAAPLIVTQFCFDAPTVARWEKAVRREIRATPIRVGLPGPASLTSLVRYARICGIGNSVRSLTRGEGNALRLASWAPGPFVRELAQVTAGDPDCRFVGAHFYSFGGVARTARWIGSEVT